MNSKEFSSKKETSAQEENIIEDVLKQIDKTTIKAEEKILLEDSIKNIIKGSENIVEHIKLMDKEKRKELLGIYNKILDGLKQKITTI
jgi:hypothetical protein